MLVFTPIQHLLAGGYSQRLLLSSPSCTRLPRASGETYAGHHLLRRYRSLGAKRSLRAFPSELDRHS